MEPTLVAGQGLVALCWPHVATGQLRCVEHPDRPGFWLVKRVVAMHPGSTMDVGSDNTEVATVDSRRFGSVPVSGSYLVALRIPRSWM